MSDKELTLDKRYWLISYDTGRYYGDIHPNGGLDDIVYTCDDLRDMVIDTVYDVNKIFDSVNCKCIPVRVNYGIDDGFCIYVMRNGTPETGDDRISCILEKLEESDVVVVGS